MQRLLLTLFAIFVAGALIRSPALAQPTAGATLFATPNPIRPGATLYLNGYGFSANARLDISLVPAQGAATALGRFNADSRGYLHARTPLPRIAVGDYSVTAVDRTIVTTASLTIVAPPQITLTSNQGKPGDVIGITVSNLIAGSIRLDYDGVPVLGPNPTDGGLFVGSFIVPATRTQTETLTIEALNLVGRSVVGTTSATFTHYPPANRPRYRIRDVALPTTGVAPGELFSITGRIEPPPPARSRSVARAEEQLSVVWRNADGTLVPIAVGDAVIDAAGNFAVQAQAPALINGDGLSALANGSLGILFARVDAEDNSQPEYVSVEDLLNPYNVNHDITVRVKDHNGAPIENALVRAKAIGYSLDVIEQGNSEPLVGSQQYVLADKFTLSHVNQFTSLLEDYELPPIGLCPSDAFGGFTDANGEVAATLQPDLAAVLGLSGTIDEYGNFQQGQKYDKMWFEIEVNALYQDYGTCDAEGKPTPQKFYLGYVFSSHTFYTTDATLEPVIEIIGPNPLITFTLPELAGYCQSKIVLHPHIGNLPSQTDGPIPVFGDVVTLHEPGFAAIPRDYAWPLGVGFSYDASIYGSLISAELLLDGATYPMQIQPSSCGMASYGVSFSDPTQFLAGPHIGRFNVVTLDPREPDGTLESFAVFAMLVKNPPAWILNTDKYTDRSIGYTPYETKLRADEIVEPSAVTAENVPQGVGTVENSTESDNHVEQIVNAGGSSGLNYTNTRDNEVVNNETDAEVRNQSVAPGNTIDLSFSEVLFDTGKIPLFRYGWGIWPIASATIGADMWIMADITQDGYIEFKNDVPLTTLETRPGVEVGVEVFFDLSILLGLVEAQASAIPSVDISLPVVVEQSVFQPDQSQPCFEFDLSIHYEVSVGVWPLEVSIEDTTSVINEQEPDNCQARVSRSGVGHTRAPGGHPTVAVDGYGHGWMAFTEADSGLVLQKFDGLVASSPPIRINDRVGLSKLNVVYYAPDKALAVGVDSTLSSSAFQSSDLQTAVNSLRIGAMLGDGDSWGLWTPLTTTPFGEGEVSLAACFSEDPACPAGGAATAVWSRDVVGDLGQHNLRLYYATFSNGSWSSVQPVDAGSTASDSQPSVTYADGVPVVAWVRNPLTADRLDARRIAYRFLDGSSPVIEPAALPLMVASPSLAADAAGNLKLAFSVAEEAEAFIGNRRTLYTAEVDCSGAICPTWSVHQVRDVHGRDIRVERPQMVVDDQGAATVVYRGVGYGVGDDGVQYYPSDPEGIRLRTGEAAQLKAHFADVPHTVQYLSQDAAVNWQVAATFDPSAAVILVAHIKGPAPLLHGRSAPPPRNPDTRRIGNAAPVYLTTTSSAPDLAVLDVLAPAFPPTNGPFSISVTVVNEGGQGTAGPIDVIAVWDDAYRLHEPAGAVQLPPLAASEVISFSLSISTSVDLNLTHDLIVIVNPDGRTPSEDDLRDNRYTVSVGGMPPVGPLQVAAENGSSLVHLHWDAVDDPRVAGYRIYRAAGDGPLRPIGSSLANGYTDIKAILDADFRYAVTTYSADGVESEPNEVLPVSLFSGQPPTVILQHTTVNTDTSAGRLPILLLVATLLSGLAWRRHSV